MLVVAVIVAIMGECVSNLVFLVNFVNSKLISKNSYGILKMQLVRKVLIMELRVSFAGI